MSVVCTVDSAKLFAFSRFASEKLLWFWKFPSSCIISFAAFMCQTPFLMLCSLIDAILVFCEKFCKKASDNHTLSDTPIRVYVNIGVYCHLFTHKVMQNIRREKRRMFCFGLQLWMGFDRVRGDSCMSPSGYWRGLPGQNSPTLPPQSSQFVLPAL